MMHVLWDLGFPHLQLLGRVVPLKLWEWQRLDPIAHWVTSMSPSEADHQDASWHSSNNNICYRI